MPCREKSCVPGGLWRSLTLADHAPALAKWPGMDRVGPALARVDRPAVAPRQGPSAAQEAILAIARSARQQGAVALAAALESLSSAITLGCLPQFAEHCLNFWVQRIRNEAVGPLPPKLIARSGGAACQPARSAAEPALSSVPPAAARARTRSADFARRATDDASPRVPHVAARGRRT